MRLIDADKVKEYILTEGFYCDTKADKEDTARKIDELFPTVKAIHIEWIQDYLATKFLPIGQKDSISKMVSEWEKYDRQGKAHR